MITHDIYLYKYGICTIPSVLSIICFFNLPKKFAAVECVYPDAAAAAARCPKLMGCLKNPAAVAAVAVVTWLRPPTTETAAVASDGLDGAASMLSMVNSDEPTADVFGCAAAEPTVAACSCPPRPASRSASLQSHGFRGDIIKPRWSVPQAVDVVVAVVQAVAVACRRSGWLQRSSPKPPASHPPSLPSNFIRWCPNRFLYRSCREKLVIYDV